MLGALEIGELIIVVEVVEGTAISFSAASNHVYPLRVQDLPQPPKDRLVPHQDLNIVELLQVASPYSHRA